MEPARLLAQQLNEERKRRKEAEAWAERLAAAAMLADIVDWELLREYERWTDAQS